LESIFLTSEADTVTVFIICGYQSRALKMKENGRYETAARLRGLRRRTFILSALRDPHENAFPDAFDSPEVARSRVCAVRRRGMRQWGE